MGKNKIDKRVLIYCRESRDDYLKNYERIETQRDVLIKYCNRIGYSNIVDIIMDDDKSGTDFSRFNLIKEKIEKMNINVIVFKNSSRLGRNQKDSLEFVEYLQEKNVEILFLDETFNDEMFGIYAWFNERRAREDSRNIRRNLYHKIEEGKLIISSIYGYDKVNKKLVVNKNTSVIVKLIYDLFLSEKNCNEIADELNRRYISTPSQYKNLKNTRKTNEWNYQHIYRILNDIRYTGTYVGGMYEKISFKFKKIKLKPKNEWHYIYNHHEAIIDLEKWEKVQKKFNKKKNCRKMQNY